MSINYSLGDPPQSEQLPEDKYYVANEDENSEGIYIEFDIPTSKEYPYWATRVYIDGLGAVAEEVQYTDKSKTKGCFYYPFVEAGKEYTIRFVFLRDEDRDKNDKDISFGHLGDDGSIGWFETKVTAGAKSKGEVRFTSKGQIDVKKNGEFRFTEKPKFQNEKLLTGDNYDWEVEIGLVEGISWAHGAERRTKWHTMEESIPNTKLYETINLYDKVDIAEGDAYSIDFICVRPILKYTHEGKTYKYQWDSFVRDIYYPPLSPNQIGGVYLEFDVPAKETYSRCDVYIDGIGKVAEMKAESINFLDDKKSRASFFYPFVEPGKKYTVRFSFKKRETTDGDFTIPTPDDTIIEYPYTVTVGAKSKGEVRIKSKGKVDAASTKQGNFKFTEKPSFYNQDLLTGKDYDWQIELGLMEGISWEHGDERRTKWHCTVQIPKDKLDTETNLYEQVKESDSIDCICVRPILLDYEYKGKKYSYQWDGFVHDVYYPLRNPDGIYVELALPKKGTFSRCDVTIDGIGKVAEEVRPLNESETKGCFFYPFLEPNKEYTIHFSFKKPEPVKEGFTIPISGSDTLSEREMNVTAGARSKGEVRMKNVGLLEADSKYNIIRFEKPTFENERLLGDDWLIEIGLMEGISWEHGDERRTKWHCAVKIHPNDSNVTSKNLCDLEMSEGYAPCAHKHDIDCLCIRPIMYYEHDGKIHRYHWDGYTSDVHYPLNAGLQEININNPADVAKIKGTWIFSEDEEDDAYNIPIKIKATETVNITDQNTLIAKRTVVLNKKDGKPFTDVEQAHWNSGDSDYGEDDEVYTRKITISDDKKTITDTYDIETTPSQYFKDCELKLSKDGSQLYIFWTDKNDNDYDEFTEIYTRQ